MAVLIKDEFAIDLAMVLASEIFFALITLTLISLVAPSPSLTMSSDNSINTFFLLCLDIDVDI